jgi:hypothetical protein
MGVTDITTGEDIKFIDDQEKVINHLVFYTFKNFRLMMLLNLMLK